jgi:hypothetical protein
MPHDNVIANVLPHIQAWWGAITAVLTLAGFILFVKVVASMGSGRAGRTFGYKALALFSAVLLVNVKGLLDALASSLFGSKSVQSLSYQAPDHPARHYIEFAVYLIAIVGLIGVGRGVLMLKDYDREPGRISAALVHIIGGIICVNLTPFLKIVGRSMGREVLEIITYVTG